MAQETVTFMHFIYEYYKLKAKMRVFPPVGPFRFSGVGSYSRWYVVLK
jgi:hypothetical protein